MKTVKEKRMTGERALFRAADLEIVDTIFDDGESPLKESRDLSIRGCMFKWKYPIWYAKNVKVKESTWFEMARAGVWYTDNVSVEDSAIEAPKNFRRCDGVTLKDVSFSNAAETLWACKNVKLKNVVARGDYFAMNCENVEADGLTLYGNYAFDGCRNVTVKNSRLLAKDTFWNCENVTVKDTFISGEYLAWNSKNVTFENCTIESLQGMCYIDNLVMRNCRLLNTTLAFEYSTVDAEIDSRIESVLNPSGGTIRAEAIGELILQPDEIDPAKTRIVCKAVGKTSDRPEWLR
ncbi:MAG: DUF3737 family protein [Firmicutes bacterium]|nr:DUF3737 family protein [Bacillota bacterium]